MKQLDIKLLESYKLYKKDAAYHLEGDLMILSGVNGSGKSQLLRIAARSGTRQIRRTITQTRDDGTAVPLEKIMLLSFRDNINLGEDFGHFSVNYREAASKKAWDFYVSEIRHTDNRLVDSSRTRRFAEGLLMFDSDGVRRPSWRSVDQLEKLLKSRVDGEKVFHLSKPELEAILPADFIWRDENDIIQQIGNLFYIACCRRVDAQIACSETGEVFDKEAWLKTAPWTILNQLFADLGFKYRFKDDYAFKTPNMEENPMLRDHSEVRSLSDLSDGEKAILKLALTALDEEISRDVQLVLFDEYDAPLNPSLAEAFFHVIEKFYISRGIQVIVATHSPATISLAPEYARFYEIFPQEGESPRIIQVEQSDYAELQKVNKQFYDRIRDQDGRIAQLEDQVRSSGKMLFVEDRYDQIYKIAYLKVKGVEGVTEENLEERFRENCGFTIHGGFSCGGLYNRLMCSNLTNDQDATTICLFDFDQEGYLKFEDLRKRKDGQQKLFPVLCGSVRDGLYVKHFQANRYALMLPIPERLEKYVSTRTSEDCFIEVETLLSEEYLGTNSKAGQRSKVLPFYKMKDSHKRDFWKDLFDVDREHFKDFEPLFLQIEKLFEQ